MSNASVSVSDNVLGMGMADGCIAISRSSMLDSSFDLIKHKGLYYPKCGYGNKSNETFVDGMGYIKGKVVSVSPIADLTSASIRAFYALYGMAATMYALNRDIVEECGYYANSDRVNLRVEIESICLYGDAYFDLVRELGALVSMQVSALRSLGVGSSFSFRYASSEVLTGSTYKHGVISASKKSSGIPLLYGVDTVLLSSYFSNYISCGVYIPSVMDFDILSYDKAQDGFIMELCSARLFDGRIKIGSQPLAYSENKADIEYYLSNSSVSEKMVLLFGSEFVSRFDSFWERARAFKQGQE
jgi:hypothetical protein